MPRVHWVKASRVGRAWSRLWLKPSACGGSWSKWAANLEATRRGNPAKAVRKAREARDRKASRMARGNPDRGNPRNKVNPDKGAKARVGKGDPAGADKGSATPQLGVQQRGRSKAAD